jgi:hypothetical protein
LLHSPDDGSSAAALHRVSLLWFAKDRDKSVFVTDFIIRMYNRMMEHFVDKQSTMPPSNMVIATVVGLSAGHQYYLKNKSERQGGDHSDNQFEIKCQRLTPARVGAINFSSTGPLQPR